MLNKLILRIRQIFLLTKVYICKILYMLFGNKLNKKKLWLIVERGNDAKDNGYVFFKYINENDKINKQDNDIRYIINRKSPDYEKVIKYGKVVKYGSLKHFYLLNKANYLLSTHSSTYIHQDLSKFLSKGLIRYKFKFIFLQHGITTAYLPQLFYPNINPDLFVCGGKNEYIYVKENFNHKENVVRYTGLARFDNLHDFRTKNQILIMPTWRSYLSQYDEKRFKLSDYYNNYNSLLNDKRLIGILEEYNYELLFYPHYEMHKFIHLFKTSSERIKIGNTNMDVQNMLKESKLLITDYSSVFFDFAYMFKPMIYYQFDKSEFIEKHYQKGYFDYDNMGFGVTVLTINELIKEIQNSIKNNCILEFKYTNRVKEFFLLNDSKNCERILKRILEL